MRYDRPHRVEKPVDLQKLKEEILEGKIKSLEIKTQEQERKLNSIKETIKDKNDLIIKLKCLLRDICDHDWVLVSSIDHHTVVDKYYRCRICDSEKEEHERTRGE